MLGLSKKPSLGRRRHDHMEERGMSSMNGNPSDQPNVAWERLPWKKLEVTVYRMQKRIFQASKRGDTKTVHKIQKLLMKSEAARLLAVRRVTQDNQGKKTAGVDGVKSVPPAERLKMVEAIHPKHMENRKAKPLRRVWIPKPGKEEKRPLGIPICLSYCLSFQAMFGIPMVANGVDQKSQPTLCVLLYHVLSWFSTPTAFPVPLRRLAQPCDDVWSERDPARAMRVSAHAFQNPSVTPIGNRRDVDIEQLRSRQCGIAPVASLPGWTEPWTLWASQGNMVGGTNPVDFAGGEAAAQPRMQPLLIEQVCDLGSGVGRSQFPHPSDDLRTGLTDFPGLFEARNRQARARLRLPANIDHDELVALGERDILDQPAQQLFALGKRGRWGVPERRQVSCERTDLLPLLRRQHQRSRFRQHLVGAFQPIDLQQLLIPLAFQTSCDQPIVRVHGTVPAASQVR